MTSQYRLLLFLLLLLGASLTPGPGPPFCFLVAALQEVQGDKLSKESIAILDASLVKFMGFDPRSQKGSAIKPLDFKDIPQHLLDLYWQGQIEREDTYYDKRVPGLNRGNANTVRSFYHDEDASSNDDTLHSTRLQFNISLPEGEKLVAAGLKLYQRGSLQKPVLPSHRNSSSQSPSKKVRLSVHEVLRPTKRGGMSLRLLDTRVIDIRKSRWHTLDVAPAINRWVKCDSSNFSRRAKPQRVQVTLTELDGRPFLDASRHVRLRRSTSRDRPYLVTYSDDMAPSRSRDKRRSGKRRKNRRKNRKRRIKKGNKTCGKHNMYVDFTEVGWKNWILAPPGFNAYYCHGECSFPIDKKLNATNHAIVQSLVHSRNPAAVPKACCVPTELGPIDMLYLDFNSRITLRKYSDMIVEACGCR